MYNRIVALCVPSLYLLMALKLHTKSHCSNADTGEISMTSTKEKSRQPVPLSNADTGEISMIAQRRRVDNPDPDDDGNNWIVIVGTFSNRPNTCANAR